MNDVAPNVSTSANFKACRITSYRRGSLLAAFTIDILIKAISEEYLVRVVRDTARVLQQTINSLRTSGEMAGFEICATYVDISDKLDSACDERMTELTSTTGKQLSVTSEGKHHTISADAETSTTESNYFEKTTQKSTTTTMTNSTPEILTTQGEMNVSRSQLSDTTYSVNTRRMKETTEIFDFSSAGSTRNTGQINTEMFESTFHDTNTRREKAAKETEKTKTATGRTTSTAPEISIFTSPPLKQATEGNSRASVLSNTAHDVTHNMTSTIILSRHTTGPTTGETTTALHQMTTTERDDSETSTSKPTTTSSNLRPTTAESPIMTRKQASTSPGITGSTTLTSAKTTPEKDNLSRESTTTCFEMNTASELPTTTDELGKRTQWNSTIHKSNTSSEPITATLTVSVTILKGAVTTSEVETMKTQPSLTSENGASFTQTVNASAEVSAMTSASVKTREEIGNPASGVARTIPPSTDATYKMTIATDEFTQTANEMGTMTNEQIILTPELSTSMSLSEKTTGKLSIASTGKPSVTHETSTKPHESSASSLEMAATESEQTTTVLYAGMTTTESESMAAQISDATLLSVITTEDSGIVSSEKPMTTRDTSSISIESVALSSEMTGADQEFAVTTVDVLPETNDRIKELSGTTEMIVTVSEKSITDGRISISAVEPTTAGYEMRTTSVQRAMTTSDMLTTTMQSSSTTHTIGTTTEPSTVRQHRTAKTREISTTENLITTQQIRAGSPESNTAASGRRTTGEETAEMKIITTESSITSEMPTSVSFDMSTARIKEEVGYTSFETTTPENSITSMQATTWESSTTTHERQTTSMVQTTQTDPCRDNPCINGTCMSTEDGDYTCQCHAVCRCAAQYTTKNCTSVMEKNCAGYFGNATSYTYYPDVFDCNKYIWCIDGRAYSYSCPIGYIFNPTYVDSNHLCVSPNNQDVKCALSPTADEVQTTQGILSTKEQDRNVTRGPFDPCDPDPCHEGTCLRQDNDDFFCQCYVCGCGQAYVSKTCDYNLPKTCTAHISDPFDCSKYYVCRDNNLDASPTSCYPEDTVYDSEKGWCNYPTNFGDDTCAKNISRKLVVDKQTTSPGTPVSSTAENIDLTQRLLTTETRGPCNPSPCPTDIRCVDLGSDFLCECQVCNCTADLVDKTCGTIQSDITGSCEELGIGNYPIVTDCTKYLWCYSGGEVIQSCPAGTAFLPASMTCGTPAACSINIIRQSNV